MGEILETVCDNYGYIYKLCFNDDDMTCYIGSTKRKRLKQRLNEHKYDIRTGRCAKNSKGKYFLDRINEIQIVLLEKYKYINNKDLLYRERYWIEQNISNINHLCPIREKQEISALNRIYYWKNRDRILNKKNDKINCPNCNDLVSKIYLKKHLKTIKCKSFNNYNII